MDIYVGKKAGTEVGLGESVVLEMTKSLIGTGCRIFMNNFFYVASLQLLHAHGLEGTGTVRKDRRGLLDTKPDREMKKGEIQSFQ